jgi:hypothetical protein
MAVVASTPRPADDASDRPAHQILGRWERLGVLRLQDLDDWSAATGTSRDCSEKGYHDQNHRHHGDELPEGRKGGYAVVERNVESDARRQAQNRTD